MMKSVTSLQPLLLLALTCGLPQASRGQQQQQEQGGGGGLFLPMMRMLAALAAQPNPLLHNSSTVQTTTTTAKPQQQSEGEPERLSQQPLSIFNWFMSPLRLAVIMKKYEFAPMTLPRMDDTFLFDTKRDWGTALGVTCACLGSLLLAVNIWLYFELQPFRLPRHPVDQTTWLSRWVTGERAGPLRC